MSRNRLEAIKDFEQARFKGWVSRIWAILRRQDNGLVSFNAIEPLLPPQRRYLGVQDVPVAQIIGTVNRPHEFDRNFHPKQDGLEGRWVNVRILTETIGWPPVQLYRVGNLYFVEDGHHRVSVANHLGLSVVEAEVWDYPVDTLFDPTIACTSLISTLKQRQRDNNRHAPLQHVCLANCC